MNGFTTDPLILMDTGRIEARGPAISFVNLTGEDTRGRVVGIPRPRRLPLANLHHNGKSRGKGWRDTWSFRERGLAPTRTRTYISTLDTRAERVVPRLSLSLSPLRHEFERTRMTHVLQRLQS